MKAVCKTDIGKIRDINQDFMICDAKENIFIVADGLGGYKNGDRAAEFCSEELYKILVKTKSTGFDSKMSDNLSRINEALIQLSYSKYSGEQMGTTILGVKNWGEKLGIISVGDTKLYGVNLGNGELDKSAQGADKTSEIMLINKMHIPANGVGVSSALGKGFYEYSDIRVIDRDYSIYILCSDGLTAVCSEEDILNTILKTEFDYSAEQLVEMALKRGAPDNVTVVIFKGDR